MTETDSRVRPGVVGVYRAMLPQLVELAELYHARYPADKTPAEVIDAVTVAVPLRFFMAAMADIFDRREELFAQPGAEAGK